MLRVAFVCAPHDRLSPARRSSVAIVAANLAREVSAAGHRVTLIAPDAETAATDATLASVELLSVSPGPLTVTRLEEVLRAQGKPFLPWQADSRYCAGYRRRLTVALGRLSPDVIVLASLAQYAPAIAAACPSARLYVHLHDELWAHLPADHVRSRLGDVAGILCVNSHIRAALTARVPELGSRTTVLHNATDPVVFGGTDSPVRHRRRLAFVGRISPEKGLHVLASAVRAIAARFPDLRLDVVGSPGLIPFGWLRTIADHDPTCRSLLRHYGTGHVDALRRQLIDGPRRYVEDALAATGAARDRIVLHGFVPHSRMQQLLSGAAAVVCPSVCNEIPMATYEGMAGGLPVVASYDLTDDGPLIHRVTGLVVPRNDARQLSEAIAELLGNPAEASALGEAARARVLTHFTWRAAAARLLTLLEQPPAG